MKKRLIENVNRNIYISFVFYTVFILLTTIIIKINTENFTFWFYLTLVILFISWLIPIGLTRNKKTHVGKFFNTVTMLHRGEENLNRIRRKVWICEREYVDRLRDANSGVVSILSIRGILSDSEEELRVCEKTQRKNLQFFCEEYHYFIRFPKNKFG